MTIDRVRGSIIVLEDSPERVDWLRRNFSDVTILWATTVDRFSRLIESTSDVRLVILDHDLGQDDETWPLDPTGKNGMDAIRCLGTNTHHPFVVWSINTVEGPRMISELESLGAIARWIPFGGSRLSQLHDVIKSQVED